MSTRATIISTSDSHIYHETNAGRFEGDKFIGWDIEMLLGLSEHNSYIKDDTLVIIPIGELKEKGLPELQIPLSDIVEHLHDADDYEITIRGGSYSEKLISKYRNQ